MLTSLRAASTFIFAFARARWGYRFKDRAALMRWQERRIHRYIHHTLDGIPFYAQRSREHLRNLPIIDKTEMLANFAALNRFNVSLDTASQFALKAELERNFRPTLPLGISVGLSSGTSGKRGIFLVSSKERALWAGTVLARILSRWTLLRFLNPLAPRLKIALCLRANSNLYNTVRSFRVRFQFCDLQYPMPDWVQQIRLFSPDVLIAPASVLHTLARVQLSGGLSVHPRQVISVAEVLEDDDSEVITQAWGLRPTQIYQCTEGLLGQSCPAGSIHLNEEFIHFEPQWLDPQGERFNPLITDFTRTAQIFARHRIDDVLRVNPVPCPCGKVTLRLSAIEGRCDDILWLPSMDIAELQPVFPDVLRQRIAICLSGTETADYRIEQDRDTWRLCVPLDNPDASLHIATAVRDLCSQQRWRMPQMVLRPWNEPHSAAKRRRIVCVARPEIPYRSTASPEDVAMTGERS